MENRTTKVIRMPEETHRLLKAYCETNEERPLMLRVLDLAVREYLERVGFTAEPGRRLALDREPS